MLQATVSHALHDFGFPKTALRRTTGYVTSLEQLIENTEGQIRIMPRIRTVEYKEFKPNGQTLLIYTAVSKPEVKPILSRSYSFTEIIDEYGYNELLQMGEADIYHEIERLANLRAKRIRFNFGREATVVDGKA